MEDYLRLYLPQIVAVVIFIAIVIITAIAVKHYAPLDEGGRRIVNRVRNALIVLVLIVFGLYLFSSGSINVTPRKVIDRSEVDKQQQDFKERNTK